MGRAEYINEDDVVINLSDFKNSSNNQRMYSLLHFLSLVELNNQKLTQFVGGAPMCFLGLEHVNKTQRRSRFNYLEKAIKIYN